MVGSQDFVTVVAMILFFHANFVIEGNQKLKIFADVTSERPPMGLIVILLSQLELCSD